MRHTGWLLAFLLVFLSLPVFLMPATVNAATEQVWEAHQTGNTTAVEVYGRRWLSQTFTVQDTPHSVSSVRFRAYAEGSPSTVTVGIRDIASDGNATDVDLTSGTINGSLLTTGTTGAWYQVAVDEYELEAFTQYAIVIHAEYGTDTNSVHIIKGTASSYTGGAYAWSPDAGINWNTTANDDILFEIYGEPAIAIDSAQVFSDYLNDDDWLFVLHYENTAAPYYPVGIAEQRFKLQLLKGLNLLENGSFEAGTTPTSWTVLTGATPVRTATEHRTGLYSASLTRAGTNCATYQSIDNHRDYRGKDMTVGAWIITSTANQARLGIYDGIGFTWSSYHTGGGEWEWISVTHSMANKASDCRVYINVTAHNGTAYFDNVHLIQSNAIPEDNIIAESVPRTWGSKPGSIYLDSSEITSLEWGSVEDYGYALRLWATYGSNDNTSYELLTSDWQGSDLGQLDNWCIAMARSMEDFYNDTFIINVADQGEVLTEDCGVYFDAGIPLLSVIRPDLFQSIVTTYELVETKESIPEYTLSARVGTDISDDMDTAGGILGMTGNEFAQYIVVILFVGCVALIFTGNIFGSLVLALPMIYIGVYISAIDIIYLGVGIFLLAALFIWSMVWSRV